MNRSKLKFLAILLSVLIVAVYFAGFDDLPRSLRAQVGEERSALLTATKQLHTAQDDVLNNLKAEPELFQAIAPSRQWPDQLAKDLGDLQLAAHNMEQLSALEKKNRRQDRQQVESLLAQQRKLRTSAVAEAATIQKSAAHWVDLKHHLPEMVRQMEQDYQTIRGIDLAAATAAAQRAGADWPERKSDLNARLSALQSEVSHADSVWQSTGEARRLAAANDTAHLDIVALVSGAESLTTSAARSPKQTTELVSLSAQLYNAWDKILVDMESGNPPRQKIRTVSTHLADASSKTGQITSDEKWVDVSPATFESRKNDLGMAVEHKPAGKYDAEAERVAQPAGFAYVATPSQGSNQYGYWDHRDGRDFWVFYGQYALLRDLLFNNRYQPVDRGDWENYRTYHSRGQTYYGRESTDSAPRYGTQGSSTQKGYSDSKFAQRGGFKDSKYATKSGSYSDSKYASPGGDRTPKQFGSGSGSSERRASPAPSRAPRSSPSSRPSSSGRRFGKR